MTNIAAAGPPVKVGEQAHNRIGTLADQLHRISQPRPMAPASVPTSRRVQVLESRVSELERLVLMLLEQRGASR